ncbi:Gfo/Idh/MocA family protein [Roseibacillus ishigakijimensis]|uniref:Gfo/Idh/MocA family oxidoreductase n=1 Tax=Roseibacillus ishigakijimensis TaxID=454146 RepID=A0A934VG62_9BACT|nr:Gfo/Idh/MocA family oxidoreductase [Roseibacillus ishigakijimensis]MBK1832503.1 Gfo/Idh/MocA family oxidoreductase [Roseibacillus ishigakijimensis]
MNRRQLLKRGAFLGTGAALAPFAQAVGANDQLRVAVIGIRSRGRSHLQAVLKSPHARLVAVCDVDPAVLAKEVAALKKDHSLPQLRTFSDYRKVCEDKEIDAVMIATPNHTHALIAITAAAQGKHVYVEKPVSHNVHEGRILAAAQKKFGVLIAHGFQHRSNSAWGEMFAWLREEKALGTLTLARGFCYKPRKSIGKVSQPQTPPQGLDYSLWLGPRAEEPVRRQQFHYDWHWQSPYGNGDLGNQGPHQLDICRWAIGDPAALPRQLFSIGGRLAHTDDGDVPNTQIVYYDTEPAPILFEVRGLPQKGLDYEAGMDRYRGLSIGNVLEYEGGYVTGDHHPTCVAYDRDGKELKRFQQRGDAFGEFIEAAVGRKKQLSMQNAESGHLSSAMAHLGNHSLALGKQQSAEKIAASLDSPLVQESFQRMREHLLANGLGEASLGRGVPLGVDADENFLGDFAAQAKELDQESYREEFALPKVS